MNNLKSHYDVIIVGAGITGASIFRYLVLNNISCLIIDKNDFVSQTSSKSSKILHGGLRYLELFDFKLIKEALREKKIWETFLPHLCYNEEFHIPVFKDSPNGFFKLKIGLILYDLLSYDKKIKSYNLNKLETLKRFPQIRQDDLIGCHVYNDTIMDDKRIALDILFDTSKNKNANIYNYTTFNDIKYDNDKYTVYLEDNINNSKYSINCHDIIFSVGPFTDQVMSKISLIKWKKVLKPSKGSHIWISNKSIPIKYPIAFIGNDKRVVFLLPQKNMVLIGTTETSVNNYNFDEYPNKEDFDYLINYVKRFLNIKLSNLDVIASFSGIRPLVNEISLFKKEGELSRYHRLFQPHQGIYVITGGKYTTARAMAVDICQRLCLKRHYNFNQTIFYKPLNKGPLSLPFKKINLDREKLIYLLENEAVRTFDDLVIRRMDSLNKRIWENKYSQNFDKFFIDNIKIINKYIEVDKNNITNYHR